MQTQNQTQYTGLDKGSRHGYPTKSASIHPSQDSAHNYATKYAQPASYTDTAHGNLYSPNPARPSTAPVKTSNTINSAPPLPSRPDLSSMVEPDPLPPHSNPQVLSQSQSQAFQDSTPIPPVQISKDTVLNPQTGQILYVLHRQAAHLPDFLSTKPLMTISEISGRVMGHVRFHSIRSSNIDLEIHGRNTKISHSVISNKWSFESTTSSNAEDKWCWSRDKHTGGTKLEEGRSKGAVLARLNGGALTFETGKLSHAGYEEVLLSAIAMVESARRHG